MWGSILSGAISLFTGDQQNTAARNKAAADLRSSNARLAAERQRAAAANRRAEIADQRALASAKSANTRLMMYGGIGLIVVFGAYVVMKK